MFSINGNKGFHLKFSNGWIASVQFGPGNYCDNHDLPFDQVKNPPSGTAEVAAFDPSTHKLTPLGNGDTVEGYVTADQVLKFFNLVANSPEQLRTWTKESV